MRWEEIVDKNEVIHTINILKPNSQLFEVRILGTDKRRVLSGYFTDANTLLSAFDNVDLRGQNVYITLNQVNSALYSRIQHDKFVANTNTTSDPEIDRYQWIFIDFDPVRPTNISSSSEELQFAWASKESVKNYLSAEGFCDPVEALSGNGYHLLYRVDFKNDADNAQLVNSFLSVLADKFNNARVKVDTTNSNPSRICKLHGTLAQKGADTVDRPHRMSKILTAPVQIGITSIERLKKVCNFNPEDQKKEQPKKAQQKPIKQEFNIRTWLADNGFSYKEDAGNDCQMLLLDECPFDANHRNGDSKIFIYTDGSIAFKCHHNSCAGKKWQDFRLKYEPDAYENKFDDSKIDEGYKKHKKLKEDNIFIPLEDSEQEATKKERKKRKLKTASGLMKKELPEPVVFIGVGEELPLLVEGTCILSAKPKLGKSWLVLSMCLAISNGEDFLGYKTKRCSTLYLDLETSEQLQQKRIKKALNGREIPQNFYLDTETDDLDHGFVEQIEDYLIQDPDIGVVVIDVFQIIRSAAKNVKENEYEHVYRDITPLNDLAQKHHISIILVCHDRKVVDPDDPFSNILGSTGLQGAATQMMVLFRRRKTDPIHISIKGKTIDGLPDIDVKLENGQWSVVDGINSEEAEKAALEKEYEESKIREVVLAIANKGEWKGRCGTLINDAISLGFALVEDNKHIGGFLHRHQGRFLAKDNVQIQIIDNGTGPKIYRINKFTIDTIDEINSSTIDEWQEASKYKGLDIPFSI